jgi:hypothetical protein
MCSGNKNRLITICHPYDEVELALLVCALHGEGIPYFVAGRYFGSLMPGVQIPSYNERAIRVPEEFAGTAAELIAVLRWEDVRMEQTFTSVSKFRMVAEALFLGWFLPVGTRKPVGKTVQKKSPPKRA